MDQLTRDRQTHVVGLDYLRILSMVMIIGLHMLGQGGILEAADPGSPIWFASRVLQCLFYCAVNCYGLISGYVGSSRNGASSRLLLLWLTVVLYSLLYWLLFRWRSPGLVGSEALIQAVFPVLTRQYWYFTGYFGLALILPLIRGGLESIDRRSAVRRFFVLLLFFSALPTVLHSDAFHMRGGYSTIWLLLLYLMGAVLRKGQLFHRLNAFVLIPVGIVCLSLTFVSVLKPAAVPILHNIQLLAYTSPTMTIAAVCLLLLFARIRGKNHPVATELSRTSFGVYILHTNPLLWWLAFRPGFLQHWASWPAWRLLLFLPISAAGVYLLCSLVDYLRILAFRKLRLRETAECVFTFQEQIIEQLFTE